MEHMVVAVGQRRSHSLEFDRSIPVRRSCHGAVISSEPDGVASVCKAIATELT